MERAWILAMAIGLLGCGGSPKPPTTSNTGLIRVSLEVRTFTLGNGMRLILQEDHHVPVVAVNLWYHVGSKDDPPGRSGFAHLFEHLMFQGSRHVSPNKHSSLLVQAGVHEANASTDYDRTNYFETLPSSQLELALWLESDRMAYVGENLAQKNFARERDVVKNERRQRYENTAYGMVRAETTAALFPKGHPYHHTPIGVPEDLDAATLDDVRAFWNRYYVPNNATLAIVGDFQAKHALELVTKYFGPIPRGPDPKVVTSAPPVKLAKERTVRMEAGVEFDRLVLTWPTPPIFSDTHCHLDVLPGYLGGAIQNELVKDTHIAHRVGIGYHAWQLGGVFLIEIDLNHGGDPLRARKLVDDEIGREAYYRPTDWVLRASGSDHYSEVLYGLESLTDRADAFNMYQHLTDNPIFATKLLRTFDSLDPEVFKKTFQEYVLRAEPVVTIVTRKEGAPMAGRLLSVTE
jgi:zinc protease